MHSGSNRIGYLIAFPLVTIGFIAAAHGEFELSWYTMDAGGEMLSTGGAFELAGTIGQADAGRASDGGFELNGGFWFGTPLGDCNSTGAIDLLDYDDFQPCITGPDVDVASGCVCFDMNQSGTVDLFDFAVLQTSFTGP